MVGESWRAILRQQRAIAVIRASSLAVGDRMAQAVAAGGMGLIEVTWNSDRAPDLVARLREILPHCWVGAGTLLSLQDLQTAIAAGAQFCFTPHVALDLLSYASDRGVPLVPGALSPTEIVTAWQAGAPSVKVFPAQSLGGPSYIRALGGPLGQIALIPTGGVTLENAPQFIAAGAIAVGLAGELFPSAALQTENWEAIAAQAQKLRQLLQPWQEAATSFLA